MLVAGIAASLGLFFWLISTDVAISAAAATVAALTLQTLSGAYLWVWVRSRSGGSASNLEVLAMGFALGTFLAMASGVLLRPIVPGGFGWAAPSVIVLGFYLFGFRKRSKRGANTHLNIDWPRRSVMRMNASWKG